MARYNLETINDLLTTTINTLTKMQRGLQEEIAAANPPADARLTREEWARLNAEEAAKADDAAKASAMKPAEAVKKTS